MSGILLVIIGIITISYFIFSGMKLNTFTVILCGLTLGSLFWTSGINMAWAETIMSRYIIPSLIVIVFILLIKYRKLLFGAKLKEVSK